MTECPMPDKFVFPQDEPNGILVDKFQRHGGLEMRDYFAAQAMAATMPIDGNQESIDDSAKQCFQMADAMMRARNQGASNA